MDAMNKAKQTIDLSEIPEGDDEVKKENIGTRKLLEGFKFLNVKIHLLTDSLDKIYQKQRYQDLFDVGVLSVASAIHMKDAELKNIFKKNGKVHLELCDNFVVLKKDQRQEYRTKLAGYAKEMGWKACESSYTHHLLYDIGK